MESATHKAIQSMLDTSGKLHWRQLASQQGLTSSKSKIELSAFIAEKDDERYALLYTYWERFTPEEACPDFLDTEMHPDIEWANAAGKFTKRCYALEKPKGKSGSIVCLLDKEHAKIKGELDNYGKLASHTVRSIDFEKRVKNPILVNHKYTNDEYFKSRYGSIAKLTMQSADTKKVATKTEKKPMKPMKPMIVKKEEPKKTTEPTESKKEDAKPVEPKVEPKPVKKEKKKGTIDFSKAKPKKKVEDKKKSEPKETVIEPSKSTPTKRILATVKIAKNVERKKIEMSSSEEENMDAPPEAKPINEENQTHKIKEKKVTKKAKYGRAVIASSSEDDSDNDSGGLSTQHTQNLEKMKLSDDESIEEEIDLPSDQEHDEESENRVPPTPPTTKTIQKMEKAETKETYMDEDGFLVTKRTTTLKPKEVTIKLKNRKDKPLADKAKSKSKPAIKKVASAKGSQRSIASFFKPK